MVEVRVGKVTHYWPKAHAAAVELEADLAVGDHVHIRGHGDDFAQEVRSLEVDHRKRKVVHPGEDASLEVGARVHAGDEVFKVVEGEAHWSVASGAFEP